QARFLIGSQFVGQVFDVTVRGRESRAGTKNTPAVRQVQPEAPGSCSAHGETTQNDTVRVEEGVPAQSSLDGDEIVDRFEHISLAGPTVGVVAAAVDVDLNVVRLGR